MNDISLFSIQNTRQIANHLALLLKEKCLISASFGMGRHSYITTLLGINESNNTVVLECGPKEYLNQHVLNSCEVTFKTEFEGIKVSFTGTALKKIAHEGDSAFVMSIPKAFYWGQRRGYYRVKSTLLKPSYCQLNAKDNKVIKLKIYDISLTGFAMLNASKEISDFLEPGRIFDRCNITLPGIGEISTSFEICNKCIINPDKIEKIQKIGCKFNNISSKAEEAIQHYIQQVQREDLQKKMN